MSKKKKLNKQMFKKSPEEVQYMMETFWRRGSKVENKKGKGSYNRQKFKKGE